MEFKNAEQVSQICWELRTADYTRDLNRARINQLFNGWPPYSEKEAEENHIEVNVNGLDATRLGHDARSQFYNAFEKPGSYFTCSTDFGPASKRKKYGSIVTREMNRIMKRSLRYYETMRSKFSLNVLHGIGPAVWENEDRWCPDAVGVEDLLVPANTYLDFRNLPFFCILRSYTAPELIKLTQGPNLDPGWNSNLVEQCIQWVDRETMALGGSNWPDIWSPSRTQERVKGDGSFYAWDQVPTIDVFDFYYWSDQDKDQGWRRRMVLDDWSSPATLNEPATRRNDIDFARNQWLFNSGSRKVADRRESIFACQFADLSAVGPFRYHSVRSLGFLLYAVCHLQNRLRCKFTEAVFENLLQMFRVKSLDDVQRALKLKLYNFAFIDDNLTPVPANQRFQPNVELATEAMQLNDQMISSNSSSWVQNQNFSRDKVEKTKFQVMAEVNAMTTLVSAGLQQAYNYQKFEYFEIVRRFFKKLPMDPEVISFQANVMRQGVPDELMDPEAWDCEPERIMGGGNKTLEQAIANQLMEWRPLFNPSAQNDILKNSVLAITDDSALAERLVPEQPHISDSVHDSELVFGTLMAGIDVTPKPGLNPVEVAGTVIQKMGKKVQEVLQAGGVGTPQDIMGLAKAAQYAQAFIEMLAQDDKSKGLVKKLNDALSKINNEVRAMVQRQQAIAQKQAQAQAQSNGQMDPKDQAKIQATQMTAQQKVENMRQSHAARTVERQIAFEQKLKQQQQQHALDMAVRQHESAEDLNRESMKNRLRSVEE